ncbi:MFS transporter [Streptomyces sp. NPDC002033]|uniref:MFS transporter n=1 Tax=unclassified Streptomyces TaxID=2593676 RepID=UPI00331F81B9
MLASMGCAGGMIMLDQTVVAVALASMASGLGLTTYALHGVALVYVLGMAAFAPVGGMAARRFGLLPTFRCGVVVFALASGACGLTPAGAAAEPLLLLLRALQGAGAGLMLPVATTLITHLYEEHERGRALATYAGLAQVFFVLGPVVGAVLTQYLGWRSLFLVNVPVAAAVLWLASKARITGEPQPVGGALTVVRPLLVVASVVLLVLGLYWCGAGGFTEPEPFAVLLGGAMALALAVRLVLGSPEPFLDLRLLGIRPYAVAVALTFAVQAAQLVVLVHGTLFLRQAMHRPLLATGLCLLPLVVTLTAGTLLSGYLLDRSRSVRVPVLLGLVVATLGAVLWTLALPSLSYARQVPGMALAGLGMGLPVPALSAELMRAVPKDKRGDASVLRQTLRQLGGAVGLATAGALVLAANDDADDAAGIVTATATPSAFLAASAFLLAALLCAAALLPPRRARPDRTEAPGDS